MQVSKTIKLQEKFWIFNYFNSSVSFFTFQLYLYYYDVPVVPCVTWRFFIAIFWIMLQWTQGRR